MRLYPKAKPVKIRILYKGREHYTLDSIKQDFDYLPILELIKKPQFHKWLEQQNENKLVERIFELFNGENYGRDPKLMDLIFLFFDDFMSNEDKNFETVYRIFRHHSKYKGVADLLLNYEFDNNPRSLEVNKILRTFDSEELKEKGYNEWNLLLTNYELAKQGNKEAKQYIEENFNWLSFDSLEVLFYAAAPNVKNRNDLPKIFAYWLENGFKRRYEEYLNKHLDFIANDAKLSSFVPNHDFHVRFAKYSTEEMNMLETFIEQVKVGKLNITAKKEEEIRKNFPHLKLIINVLEEFKRKSIALKGGLPFKSLPLNNIYDKLMINIIKRHQREIVTAVASTEPYLDYWINIRRLYDAKNSFNAVLDAYFYSEKKFKELHADFPYING